MRNTSKLTDLLKSRNVPEELIQNHLNIVTGNVKDGNAISKTLFHTSFSSGIADTIVSGIGGTPVFKPNPLRPTLDDPTICQDTTSIVLKTLKSNEAANQTKPLFIVISTTGISDHGRDIPIAMIPLYHWLLPVPHADKKKMETLLAAEAQSKDSVVKGFVAVRPSLLTDGPLLGVEKVRAGTESQGRVAKEAIGYTISRNDVGNWIYSVLVEEDASRDKFVNHFVGITY